MRHVVTRYQRVFRCQDRACRAVGDLAWVIAHVVKHQYRVRSDA